MTKKTIDSAVKEAQEFIIRAKPVRSEDSRWNSQKPCLT